MSKLTTISYLNRLINAGANREYVAAVSAIWYLQASKDPNTIESQKLVPKILGTLEYLFVEEAKFVDEDVYNMFIETINRSEYGALFDDHQPIFDVGRNEIMKIPSFHNERVRVVYNHYANVIFQTTKQPDKNRLFLILESLAEVINTLLQLANEAEKNLF